MGGIQFLGVNGAPTTPWKYDKNNWQPRVGAAYQINEKTVVARRLRQVLPESDGPVVHQRIQPVDAR